MMAHESRRRSRRHEKPLVKTFALLIASLGALFAASGCRIEKRIVEVSLDVPEQQGFFFAPEASGMGGQAVRWKAELRYGQASRTITPTRASALAGYGGLGRRLLPPRLTRGADPSVFCRPFEEIGREPRVKIAYFEGQNEAGSPDGFVITSFDLVAVTQDLTQALLGAAQDTLGDVADWGHGNFQVTATHTHSGPSGLSTSPVWGAFACDAYRREYREQVVSAFRETLLQAKSESRRVLSTSIREVRVAEDVVSRYDGMEADDRVTVLNLQDGEKVIGCLFTFAAHSTYFGPDSLRLSSDLAGELESAFAAKLAADDCFFLNGLGGNAVAQYSGRSLENYAKDVAENVAFALADVPLTDSGNPLSYAATAYSIPAARLNFGACRASYIEPLVSLPILDELPRLTKLAMLEIGDFVFLFVPGELVKTAGEILEQGIAGVLSDSKDIRFVTTANDYGGYLIPSFEYAKPGLEACSSLHGPGHLGALDSAAQGLRRAFASP